LYFDEGSSQCVTPAETTCDIVANNLTSSFAGGFEINCGSDALFRYPLNCNFFYQCFEDGDQETIFVFSCAAGLVFDESSAQCVSPEETSSCSASDNVIKTAPFFQLGQTIDIRQFLPKYRADHQIGASDGVESKSKLHRSSVDQSSQAVVDAVSSLVGKLAKQYENGAQQQPSVAEEKADPLSPHFFQYRKVQTGTFGARIVPRMRKLYGQPREQ
jgi:hypothetical protein